MTIEESIRSYLSNNYPVSNLVGSRIYSVRLPDGATLPALTYQRISTDRAFSHDGASDYSRPRFQFKAFSESYQTARATADALIKALDGYKGYMSNIFVHSSRVENDFDFQDPDSSLYNVVVDVMISYRREG